ncbi:MAG: tetratricopeptide repeat protein [Pirellulales bacterium]
MPTRRERLEAMLVDDPRDAFLRYGLAVELAGEGDDQRALTLFQELMSEQPPYVAAFARAAQLLEKHHQIADARTVLRAGIEAARRQGDTHAAGEMSEFLVALGMRGE